LVINTYPCMYLFVLVTEMTTGFMEGDPLLSCTTGRSLDTIIRTVVEDDKARAQVAQEVQLVCLATGRSLARSSAPASEVLSKTSNRPAPDKLAVALYG